MPSKKIKPVYSDLDAQQHQEVVTPPELVEEIYKQLDPKDFKNVLDPCVGPGALSMPMLVGDVPFETLTLLDIQERHIRKLQEEHPEYQPSKIKPLDNLDAW